MSNAPQPPRARRSMSQYNPVEVLEQVGTAIILVNTTGHIQQWSQSACELYGWTAEEASGHRLTDLLQEQYPHGEDRELARAALRAQASWTGLVVQRHRDGHALWMLSSRRPLAAEPGGVIITN